MSFEEKDGAKMRKWIMHILVLLCMSYKDGERWTQVKKISIACAVRDKKKQHILALSSMSYKEENGPEMKIWIKRNGTV